MTPTEGLNLALDVENGIVTPAPARYIGLFGNNYTPILTDTGATFPTAAGELTTQYDEATRPLYVPAAASGGRADNSASLPTFTFNTTVNVFGCFLITGSSAKADLTGILRSAVLFASPRTYVAGETLSPPYYLIAQNL